MDSKSVKHTSLLQIPCQTLQLAELALHLVVVQHSLQLQEVGLTLGEAASR